MDLVSAGTEKLDEVRLTTDAEVLATSEGDMVITSFAGVDSDSTTPVDFIVGRSSIEGVSDNTFDTKCERNAEEDAIVVVAWTLKVYTSNDYKSIRRFYGVDRCYQLTIA